MQTSPYNLQSAEKLCVVTGFGTDRKPGRAVAELGEGVGGAGARGERARGRLDKSVLSGSEGGRLSHPHHLHKDVTVLNLSYRVQQRH